MLTTGNLGLKKPEGTDVVNINDINSNMDKLDIEVVKKASNATDGRMSKQDKAKLDGIASGANKYVHPSKHSAGVITQDSSHRFVTDIEKNTWNNKADREHTHDDRYYLREEIDKSMADILQRNPTINDDITKGYFIGKHIINENTGEEWICIDNTENKSIWKRFNYDKSINPVLIYGVKIDKTNSNPKTAVTYIDDSINFIPAKGNNGSFSYGSWENKFPFNQIKPCLYKNGSVNYYLNPNDYTKKTDGSGADITSGNDGDVMIEFPKVYWKFETIGNDIYIRYSDKKIDSSYKCLAHMRGTTEKDKCYISAYLGCDLSSKLRSLSGKTPTASKTIGAFRTLAKANGSNYDQMAYYQLLMLQVLFIVMFKSRDSQTALGRGYVDGNSATTTTGNTNLKGLFYGENTGKQQNKFCGIEDFWGNCRYWIDGMYCDSNRHILIGNKNYNDIGSDYVDYGQGATTDLSGYISDIQNSTETGFIVKATSASSSTYYCDFDYLYASRLPSFGGYWSDGSSAGAFRLVVNYSASNPYSALGGRLLAL